MSVALSAARTLLAMLLVLFISACGQPSSSTSSSGQPAAASELQGSPTPRSRSATATPSARPTRPPAERPTVRPTAQAPPSDSGLPQVRVGELPPEARDTLELIAQDGPFPYDRDGVTFQNREQLLPRQPRGYYREYTVPTPGENDRGARRLVVGDQGEVYYTADHYESFAEVVP